MHTENYQHSSEPSMVTGATATPCPEPANGLLLVEAKSIPNPLDWLAENRSYLSDCLHTHGGVLLRSFDIHALSEFNRFSQSICPNLLDYTYRSTPRSNLGGKIYTTTEYPADQHIPLHNENAYSDVWPSLIMFFCAVEPTSGGETPIADSRKVLQRIPQEIVEEFEHKRVLYVRNYSPGVDLSWQDVFQTQNKEEVERFCEQHNIECVWNHSGPELTTKQICQATLTHPVTGEKVWFNQAHLFHISSLSDDIAQSLLAEVGELGLPRNAFYGDGSPINIHTLGMIREAYRESEIVFPWQQGDIMILDNVLMAHGRRPYSGLRKIVVSMG